jgi:hypothetical protein
VRHCWYCGSATREHLIVDTRPGLSVCYRCIKGAPVASPHVLAQQCVACGKQIGSRRWLVGAPRLAGLVKGEEAICMQCIGLLKDIVRLKEDERRSV